MLLRAPAARRALQLPTQSSAASSFRPVFSTAATKTMPQLTLSSRLCTNALQTSRAQPHVQLRSALGARTDIFRLGQPRFQTQFDKPDTKREESVAQKILKAKPDLVSTTSSVHSTFSEQGVAEPERDVDMLRGVKGDIATIRETFDLSAVPREAYVLGLAGVLPYVATSAGTIFACYEINHAVTAGGGSGTLISGGMAEAILHILEPLQIGYGAVIISFLGAIHWGLEWAQFGGRVGYARYAIGVMAPAVAWPTLLLSPNYALISQFLAFVFLYYSDSRAARRGWAPSWYGMYRFVLTFIVGTSIVASLIGRGEISHMVGTLPNANDRVKAFRETAAQELSADQKRMQQAQDRKKEHSG